jgi:hypothetical protein
MKLSSDSAAADRFEERLRAFPGLVSGYQPGDIRSLCELALTVVMGEEYWINSNRHPVLTGPCQKEVEHWYRTLYAEQIVLVLKQANRGPLGYSRRYILKQLRGQLAHGDQNDRSPKDELFRAFAFEGANPSTVEFALTWNWLNSGGLSFSTGNVDSHNPFREKIRINEREPIEVTTLESIALSACGEFWHVWQFGDIPNTGRIAMTSEEAELVTRFGPDLGKKCYETVQWHLQRSAQTRAQQ